MTSPHEPTHIAYNKILVARNSPQNKCLGPEDAYLVPASPNDRAAFALRNGEHFFSSLTGRISNMFGWVESIANPITAEDLLAMNTASILRMEGDDASNELPDIEWYIRYLRSVSRQENGTPMGCSWVVTNLPGARMRKLNVHKVLFYNT